METTTMRVRHETRIANYCEVAMPKPVMWGLWGNPCAGYVLHQSSGVLKKQFMKRLE